MKRQFSRVADKPLPVYFDLNEPEHVKAVRITAAVAAMDSALTCASGRCDCKQRRFINHLDSSGQGFLALYYARFYGNLKVDGKRGTNNEERFKSIFVQITPPAYSGFLAFLQCNPRAVAALVSLNNRERQTTLVKAVEAQLHLLDSPSNKPLSLVWPAPTAEKSEVL